MTDHIDGKSIMVTGGTGSFGQRFIQKILMRYKPLKVIVYSRDELKQFNMQNSDVFSKYEETLRYFIGDIRDRDRLELALSSGVDIIIHAAALKHVPAIEYNPFEAVKTNIIGSQNVIEAALRTNVSRVVALSTDKASSPINLYGATKLAADKLFVSANNYSMKAIFSVVRYGNVMGSRGSVIPFFLKIKDKGVLPITDKAMTRFNITLDEGIDIVLWTLKNMLGGEIVIPKIPSYRILDIADAIAPEAKKEFIGLRPGEKIHEEMLSEGDAPSAVDIGAYYVILPSTLSKTLRLKYINDYGAHVLPPGFSYNSGTNQWFLNVEDLKKLMTENIGN